ncbi:hypothetical protein JRQ81_008654 [Phrynocephalus forsythii]|uniref:Tim10-like domain-containing protein n=1 Tax=Phrynocephalus forsythii TaxID=171643 RepID=A0A9Q0XBE6_9SAUR|nr:hypothetical protein JRQ81_008654 [Phrynocephalus forsythii]
MAAEGDFGSVGSGGRLDPGALMEQVKVQIAVANAQELLQRMTDKCFRKCIGKPGSSLDNSEQKCIAMCMDRYMDAWNTVSRAYNSRLQRERANMCCCCCCCCCCCWRDPLLHMDSCRARDAPPLRDVACTARVAHGAAIKVSLMGREAPVGHVGATNPRPPFLSLPPTPLLQSCTKPSVARRPLYSDRKVCGHPE